MSGSRATELLLVLSVGVPLGCSHPQTPVAQGPAANVVQMPAVPNAPTPVSKKIQAENSASDNSKKGPEAIFFDFDSAVLREDALPALAKVATEVKRAASDVTVEGNCDELGTIEYNLALGQHRAEAAKQYLVHMGIPSQRIRAASFGSQRPRYLGHDEVAHAKNRRDDLIYR